MNHDVLAAGGRLKAQGYPVGIGLGSDPEIIVNTQATSNNRYLISGRASMIVNAIAAIRALEAEDPDLAAKVQLAPVYDRWRERGKI